MKNSGIPLLRALALTLGLGLAAATAAASVPDTVSGPRETVAGTSEEILRELKRRRAEFRKSDQALNDFIRSTLGESLDRDYSARLVLGIHGRGATPDQINRFSKALSDTLMRRYGHALLDINPETDVKVTGETPLRGGKIVRVTTEVQRSAGLPIPVDYLMRQNADGRWRAFDVIVEGVSYVQTYRAQFDQPIRQRGLDQVTADLSAGKIEIDEGTDEQG